MNIPLRRLLSRWCGQTVFNVSWKIS